MRRITANVYLRSVILPGYVDHGIRERLTPSRLYLDCQQLSVMPNADGARSAVTRKESIFSKTAKPERSGATTFSATDTRFGPLCRTDCRSSSATLDVGYGFRRTPSFWLGNSRREANVWSGGSLGGISHALPAAVQDAGLAAA